MSREEAEALFLEQLETIKKITRFLSRRAGLHEAQAEDFASYVHVRLIENDYGVVRRFESRCSFQTYLTLVIGRFLLDYRIHLWGKWHPSAAAKRLGKVAIELEKVLIRDGRTLEEALPVCRAIDPDVTMQQLEELAKQLPPRAAKPRDVPIDDVSDELHVSAETAHEATRDREREAASRDTSDAVRTTFRKFSEEDQVLLRLRFGSQLTVPQIARMMGLEEKPLYRRIQDLLRKWRQELENAGITRERIDVILSSAGANLDFQLNEESDGPRPSKPEGNGGDKGGGSH